MDSVGISKASIRKEISRMREEQDAAEAARKSRKIADLLFGLAEFKMSRRVLAYLSLPMEVQTGEMIERCFQLGKKVYVPLVDKDARRLKLTELPGLDIEFEESDYGIRVPAERFWKIVPPTQIDFVIAPGVAFDPGGGRIGFGGGYYDRLFRDLPRNAVRVAVGFHFQLLESVPQKDGDERVQKIVTEQTTINC